MKPCLAWLALSAGISGVAAKPIPVKVVVVAMFERGADTGDDPGEFQYWVERLPLTKILPFPAGYRDLRFNAKTGVLGVVTGIGTAKAAATIMALGLDPRFDFSHTYWLVAGIAGIDPADGTLASAAWAEWVVDGDIGHEIDAREIPKDWKTGYVPLRRSTPYESPLRVPNEGEAYHLDAGLVEWAYQLTRGVPLPDTAGMRERRQQYAEANARKAPFVMKGDTLSSGTFWHGKLLNAWANDWVAYHTGGRGNYVTCAMEDTGTLQSLTFLGKAGRVDARRVLVLRTASNFDQQRPGQTAAESLGETRIGKYSAFLPSLESAFRVGRVVVDELVAKWSTYRDHIPAGH